MTGTRHRDAARQLLAAYASGVPTDPLTEQYPDFHLDDAYQVQQEQLQEWLARGRTVVGHKVGLTAAAMQKQLGIDQPDYGLLFDDSAHDSGAQLSTADLISPLVEPEVAFVLAHALKGPGVTPEDALAAVGHVSASLEVIDSRIADWRIGLVDTIADNASSAAHVIQPLGVRAGSVDLTSVDCHFSRNGEVVERGRSDAVLGSPVNALAWLANTLGSRGVGLEAGHVILSGAITAAVPTHPGDTFSATLTGIGTVTARFV